MENEILDILKKTNRLPFLFIGSGLSRRYLELEDWEGLLKKFATMSSEEEYAYELFWEEANDECEGNDVVLLPKVAEKIERTFNKNWYKDPKFTSSREIYKEAIANHISPFKLEIAKYMNEKSSETNESYKRELDIFKKIGKKSISGVITTNYDIFLEKMFDEFTTYVGQEELMFSEIQGVSEIYKIHGCASKPETIIINEKDYVDFNEKNAYLVAKLLTIFLEHPIIFLGYSINDKNIKNILESISKCLSQKHLEKLKDRLIFIEWDKECVEKIVERNIDCGEDKNIVITEIRLNDFTVLYKSLLENESKYNVSTLRGIKKDIYEMVLTNDPSEKIKVVDLEDDDKLDEVEVVIGVGVIQEFSKKGYSGLSADEIYEDIVLNSGRFDSERIVNDTLPRLLPSNTYKLPMYKYLKDYDGKIPENVEKNKKDEFDDLLSDTIKLNREKDNNSYFNSNIKQLTEKFAMEEFGMQESLKKIPYIKQENIKIEDLENFLKDYFDKIKNPLRKNNGTASNSELKRVIRIYDWLKYK